MDGLELERSKNHARTHTLRRRVISAADAEACAEKDAATVRPLCVYSTARATNGGIRQRVRPGSPGSSLASSAAEIANDIFELRADRGRRTCGARPDVAMGGCNRPPGAYRVERRRGAADAPTAAARSRGHRRDDAGTGRSLARERGSPRTSPRGR